MWQRFNVEEQPEPSSAADHIRCSQGAYLHEGIWFPPVVASTLSTKAPPFFCLSLSERLCVCFYKSMPCVYVYVCVWVSWHLLKEKEKTLTAHYSNKKFPLKTSHIPFVLLEISLNPSRLMSPHSLSTTSLWSLIKRDDWAGAAVDRPRCDQNNTPGGAVHARSPCHAASANVSLALPPTLHYV